MGFSHLGLTGQAITMRVAHKSEPQPVDGWGSSFIIRIRTGADGPRQQTRISGTVSDRKAIYSWYLTRPLFLVSLITGVTGKDTDG